MSESLFVTTASAANILTCSKGQIEKLIDFGVLRRYQNGSRTSKVALKDVEHVKESYIDIRDAAELVGYNVKFLRKLLKKSNFAYYKPKSSKNEMVSWTAVTRISALQQPYWATVPPTPEYAEKPDPAWLLYTDSEEVKAQQPIEHFQNRIDVGNCIETMQKMPDGVVQSVVTSPPYWGVRKYPGAQSVTWADGTTVPFGEESTVEEYVAHTLEIFRHLKRVLKDDGTIWWNLGDTYQTRAYMRSSSSERTQAIEGNQQDVWRDYPHKRYSSGHPYLKDKDLTLYPFMVAMGAQRLGLWCRSVIIWHKNNVGVDSAKDRPRPVTEYIFLFAKSRFYKYDHNAATELSVTGNVIKRVNGTEQTETTDQRALRNVWRFPTSSQHGGHTAAFPIELPLRCLQLTTEPDDLVFDPFAGSGTTLAAARLLGCNYYGCDIFEEFVEDARRRVANPGQPLRTRKRLTTEDIANDAQQMLIQLREDEELYS